MTEETRGGEAPEDWAIAESARRAAEAIAAFNRAFRNQENLRDDDNDGSDNPCP